MKNLLKFRFIVLAFLGMFLFSAHFSNLYGQDAKKNKLRIKADYFKIVDSISYLDIATTSRINKKNVDVPNIELSIFNELEDKKIKIGSVTTNMHGKSRFVLENFNEIKLDSTNIYNIAISFKGNDSFKKATKRLSFKDAEIKANFISKDSTNYITATLIDKSIDSLVIGESLGVHVQRLFRSLPIGEEFNYTDENGTILVPIEEGIPGVDGILIIEVVLNDSDEFGTVKALVKAPVGIPIVDESTFDQRKMWSPRNKTPLFLLIFPNLLILGMWGIIVYLFINLFRIGKS
jgi:hypothetical protein